MNNKKFNILNGTSKFAICGVPLRADTYKTCDFGCVYCFSNNRKIMEFDKTSLQVGNLSQMEKKLLQIDSGEFDKKNFVNALLYNKITWHCGGMSDPFQRAEEDFKITSSMIDISSKFNYSILFSTKTDSVYGANISSNLHTFQLSFTNMSDNTDLESNVPSFESRYKFYKELKKAGFKVGIRLQPFIPNVTELEMVDVFHDADQFTIEGIKLVPQNKEAVDTVLDKANLNKADFTQKGLLNLKAEIRAELYKPFIQKLNDNKMKFSIADNDMHNIGNNNCCCGDALVQKATGFDNTSMYRTGESYTLGEVKEKLGDFSNCKVNNLFTSNRQEGCKTISEFYDKRFDRKTSPFSPKFTHKNDNRQIELF